MAAPDLPAPIEAGRTLGGRYRLVQPIARGGMAEVWEGHDEVLSRPVAVKVLRAHLAEDGVFLERFRREAVTAARLAHPGVVSTFDTGVDTAPPTSSWSWCGAAPSASCSVSTGPSSPGWRWRSPGRSPTPWPTPIRPVWSIATSSPPTCFSPMTSGAACGPR